MIVSADICDTRQLVTFFNVSWAYKSVRRQIILDIRASWSMEALIHLGFDYAACFWVASCVFWLSFSRSISCSLRTTISASLQPVSPKRGSRSFIWLPEAKAFSYPSFKLVIGKSTSLMAALSLSSCSRIPPVNHPDVLHTLPLLQSIWTVLAW